MNGAGLLAELLAGDAQPGGHGGAAVGLEALDGVGGAVFVLGRGLGQRERDLGDAGAGDDAEPGVVAQQVDGLDKGTAGGADLVAIHRAGAVDEEGLDQFLARSAAGQGRGDAHDGVDLVGPLRQILVLEHLSGEGGHRETLSQIKT